MNQILSLQDSVKINNRYFNKDGRFIQVLKFVILLKYFNLEWFGRINKQTHFRIDTLERKLFLGEVEDKLPIQSKDDVLATMSELNTLSSSGKSQQRASLFHKLVSEVRGLKNETLSGAVDEMMKVSEWLTWQALFQCGTDECTSAVLQILRTFDEAAVEVDAMVYALGLLPQASPQRVRDMLSMAQNKPSKAIMYALANTVKR